MLAVFIGGIAFIGSRRGSEDKAAYYEVVQYFEQGKVTAYTLNLSNGKLEYQLAGEKTVQEYTVPNVTMFVNDIHENVVAYNAKNPDKAIKADYEKGSDGSIWLSLLPTVVLIGIVVLAYFFLIRKMGSAMGSDHRSAMNFSKARVRNGADQKEKKTFDDVAGADEEKEELSEIVRFLKNPQKFNDLGARIPKGVLLVGPPGTGKTLLAKAVAGEADAPFLSISGSNFVELYVGVGASRVRDLFEQAKKQAPAIIFIDEIDAVGRHRGAGMGGGHDEREQTLNQLLVEMDGFGVNEGIIIIAATNRPDILDPALLRPGRFDRQVTVSYPDMKGREEILKVHARNKPLAPDVNLKTVAKTTAGFTGADLENLLNEAALLAARYDKKAITMELIDEAAIKVVVGPEKKSRKMSDKEKKLTAFHEGGHAIATYFLEGQDPVHQVSIIPRGRAGGFTMSLPSEDKSYQSKNEMLDDIVVLLGGRVAEALVLGDISTGASNDIKRATDIARNMITRYGMSEKLGPITFGDDNDEVFLGMQYSHVRNYSEEIAAEIDKEVNRIISEQYRRTEQILNEHMDSLELVANALLEREKLEGEEFKTLIETGSLPPQDGEETSAGAEEQPAETAPAQEPMQTPLEAQENTAQPPAETVEQSDVQAENADETADE
ncbi:MAG: ATP-dependent zinc metalloprotease FtsH [Ruminococcaceae bacterium]|nr:ATP-dependent zinc metalloprotease FtsH [Oscillospiraceae bacterium]